MTTDRIAAIRKAFARIKDFHDFCLDEMGVGVVSSIMEVEAYLTAPDNWLEIQLEEARKDYEKWPDWKKKCSRTGEFIRNRKSSQQEDTLTAPDAVDVEKSIAEFFALNTEAHTYFRNGAEMMVVWLRNKGLLRTAGDGWLPIDSAPKDGTAFIGYSPLTGVCQNVMWSHERQDFDYMGRSARARGWTHWQPQRPLPEPPKAEVKK